MLLWLLAAVAGLLGAAVQYGRASFTSRVFPLAILRGLAAALVVALLLDARVGRGSAPRPDVALDASESWGRAAGRCTGWSAALDSARRIAGVGGSWLRFGDSVRDDVARGAPTDRSSNLRALSDRATVVGHPVVIVTDGELDDAELLPTLPRGSRVVAIPCPAAPDVAVASLEAPRALLAGDTLSARVTLMAGGAGGPAGRLELRLDDAIVGAVDVPAIIPYAERGFELRGLVSGGERGAVLRAVFNGAGDAEPRNDTLAIGADVTRAPAAVFVSTAPDYDAREAVGALRGVTSLPTRAYYRVAPGAWRSDGTLARVDEATVRAAVQGAPLVVLHGDTTVFGPPRSATRASLLLFMPPATDEGEWFAAAAPPSPLAAGLAALPLDSLPPLNVAPGLPKAAWTGLLAHRGGATDDRRAVLVGWDEPRRIAILGASGFWRWRFRGGVRADAYGALFGGLFDWLAAGRSDRRALVPDAAPVRAGSPVRWRRGAPADTQATVILRRRGATARVQSVTLHFTDGASVAESPPLAAGIYDATVAGGSAVLVVNVSRELVPRRPTVKSGSIGGSPAVGEAPTARSLGWLYAAVILLLCAEWLLRRQAGLR
jgi:hypothetical protein